MTTTVERSKLLAVITAASKVISGKKPSGLDDYYNKFVFNGQEMYASTHEVGLSSHLETSFKGAVDGKVFKSILDTMTGESITLSTSTDGSLLTITDGATDIELPFESLDNQVSLLPLVDLPESEALELNEFNTSLIYRLLAKVINTASQDDPRDWMRCVHFFVEDYGLAVYSTAGFQIARAGEKQPNEDPQSLSLLDGRVVNAFFVRVFLDLVDPKSKVTLKISGSYFQAHIKNARGDFVIQAGVAEKGDRPIREPYDNLMEQIKGIEPAIVPIDFPDVIDQSRILLHEKVNPLISLVVTAGKMRAVSGDKGFRGHLSSRLMDFAMPDVTVQTSPDRISSILEESPSRLLVTREIMAFSGEAVDIDFDYLTAVVS